MTYRVEPLADQSLSRFNCGNAELDDWLHRHARSATGQGTRTYVVVGPDGAVVGYFAVTPHLLTRQDAPPRPARGAPRQIPARQIPAHQIPAVLLAWPMAVSHATCSGGGGSGEPAGGGDLGAERGR